MAAISAVCSDCNPIRAEADRGGAARRLRCAGRTDRRPRPDDTARRLRGPVAATRPGS